MPRGRRSRGTEYSANAGRLEARPIQAPETAQHGRQVLGLDTNRDALLYVPAGYQADQPAALAVMLHGAGGVAEHGLSLLQQVADAAGIVLLAPASRRETWDMILGGYGPDIAFIDRALEATFARCAIDSSRIAVGGFSDGASYALSVGLTNGDLFTHVIAFSPGFLAPAAQRGTPRIFIAHGLHDQVLPIEYCSRKIVPLITDAGYDLRYHEFDGPHTVPPAIVREAVAWFTAPPD